MQTQWQQATVTTRGGEFHYTRTGAGTGKPVIVLAHGYSDSSLVWGPIIPYFEADCDLILPDARGHGLSARVRSGEEIDLAAALAGFIEALGIEKAIICGHSMGACTAGALGERFPHLARALILEDPAWFDWPAQPEPAPEPEEKSNPWKEWLLSLPGTPTETIMAKCRADNPHWGEDDVRVWVDSKLHFDPNFIDGKFTPDGDWRGIVRSLQAPTLLLIAETEKGAVVGPAMAAELCSLSPRVVVAAIPNAGHNIHRENRPAFIAAMRKFLKEIG